MNLVVVARRPELAERCAATIQAPDRPAPVADDRHPVGRPRRSVVAGRADRGALRHAARRTPPETCAETIHVTAGGEAGRHLSAIATPLIIHDLPVTVWWPGEPPHQRQPARTSLDGADRLVVDGSTWSGDGLDPAARDGRSSRSRPARDQRLRPRPPVALAGGDRLDLRRSGLPAVPALAARGSRSPTAPTTRRARPGRPTWSKPIYHVGWLGIAARALAVEKPLLGRRPRRPASAARPAVATGQADRRVAGSRRRCPTAGPTCAVVVRPVVSTMPAGTTLRVELLAERRGSELRADVTAEAETVHVRVWQDGVEALDRHFRAPAADGRGPPDRGDRGPAVADPVGGRGSAVRRRTLIRGRWGLA